MTASQHMIQSNGLRFRVLVDGPAQGDAVVMLHGFPEGAESWSRQVSAVAQAGALAIAPDMRGFGMSEAPEDVEGYRLEQLVEDVIGIARAFGRDRIHVAGHDWGAIVAWFFAAWHPQMTRSLTVLSCGHPAAMAEAARVDADQQDRSRYIDLFLMQGKAEDVLSEDGHRRVRAMFDRPNPGAVSRGAVDHFTRSLARPGRLTAALNYYRANLGSERWGSLALDVEVGAPTVLLWGDRDPALGRLQAELTRDHASGEFSLEILEGAGHWLQFERPAEISRSLVDAVSKK